MIKNDIQCIQGRGKLKGGNMIRISVVW